jgi:NitT/TauT family transport system permease protein
MKRVAWHVLPPLTTLVVVLLAWWGLVRALDIPAYVLPLPGAVWGALVDGFADGSFWPHIAATAEAASAGFLIGCIAAFLVGVVLAESPVFERFLMPLVVALQAVPKVALAPLILVWFGFGLTSIVVLVVLICFFPLFVNTVVGIRSADRDLIALCQAACASRGFIFWHVKLPGAASAIFAGLQVAASLALIGAVVGEFVAAQRGLGYLIASSSVSMSIATMFAGVVILAVMGIAATAIVRWIHARVVFWEALPDQRGTE